MTSPCRRASRTSWYGNGQPQVSTPPAQFMRQCFWASQHYKEGDLPYMEGPPSRALIGGACHPCGSGPLSHSAILKGGTPEHGNQCSPCLQCPPQTLASQSDPKGAEARGTVHCAAATVVSSTPTPTTTTAATMSSSLPAQGISK
jgi:hypothetical protein